MALNSINTNIAAYSAQANIGKASNSASASIARLSSGNRITKASDDVAALAIGTSLRTGVTTLKTALLNASQGSSLLQVADGALAQLSEILQRQKAIATQAGSGSLGATERGFLNQEFQNLTQEIDRIASTTNFNGVELLNGGLGTTLALMSDPALAATYTPDTVNGQTTGSTVADSVSPVQAFSIVTGAELAGAAAAGELDVTDSAGALLTSSYESVSSALAGQFESFKLSNLTYGAGTGSATLTARINGVDFTGVVNDTDTTVLLRNGSTYINIGITAADLDNESTAQQTQTQIGVDFINTVIQRTSVVQGADFTNTALEGAVGTAAYGTGAARLSDSNAVISNFSYAGNTGAANTNILNVTINGTRFTATTVEDLINTGNSRIAFTSGDQQTFVIDLAGMDTPITNIRTSEIDRNAFINALNVGFGRAGSGLDFQVGATSDDSLKVSLGSASTTNLYNGQVLNVATAGDAANAVTALDIAISKVTSLRADVGAVQSRFNFASANLESSIQNQDAARGTLLDTDVAGESTAYATAQVQLQAGIAVLAQANLLPQNLLKLIG